MSNALEKVREPVKRDSDGPRIRTLLICHEDADLDRFGISRWLGSFSELVGVVVLREPGKRVWRRIRREIKRVGFLRFADVLAFRTYYKLLFASSDLQWERDAVAELRSRFPDPSGSQELFAYSPNTSEVEQFIREAHPDILIARCKTLLRESIFTIARDGTFVMHPGICPEYRNAHGCFWALANGDLEKVGLTLLKIDRGVDTGPVYGYYSYPFDEVNESHVRIQHRCLLENLDMIARKIINITQQQAQPLDTHGRSSATWGQPWLTKYLKWRRDARRRKNNVVASANNAHGREAQRG